MPSDADLELAFYEKFLWGKGLEPYPVQEQAITQIFKGKSVLVTVPTGTGKTLMAKAALFAAKTKETKMRVCTTTELFNLPRAELFALHAEIVAELHEAGRVAPSLTTIGGRTAIRAAIVNHRTTVEDVETLVDSVLAFDGSGRERSARNSNTTRAFTMAGVFAGIAAEPAAGDR